MKIKERVESLMKYKGNYWIAIFNNKCEYSPLDIGFFLEDAEEYLENHIMEFELDTETTDVNDGINQINLGFNGIERN